MMIYFSNYEQALQKIIQTAAMGHGYHTTQWILQMVSSEHKLYEKHLTHNKLFRNPIKNRRIEGVFVVDNKEYDFVWYRPLKHSLMLTQIIIHQKPKIVEHDLFSKYLYTSLYFKNGYQSHSHKSKLHRFGGPALIDVSGDKFYYHFGQPLYDPYWGYYTYTT